MALNWIFKRIFERAAARDTVAPMASIALGDLETPVQDIRLSYVSGSRAADCAARWNELDAILLRTPARESLECPAMKDAHRAINAIAGTLFVAGDQRDYAISKSTIGSVTRGIALIHQAAVNYDTHEPDYLRAGYRGNVVPFRPRDIDCSGETIRFGTPAYVNHAPELFSFVQKFGALSEQCLKPGGKAAPALYPGVPTHRHTL